MFNSWLNTWALITTPELFVIAATLLAAYIIFGITGFGTALVASPILAHYMPLSTIIPLLALLDFTAAVINTLRDSKDADTTELKRLIPLMVIGSCIGVFLLLRIDANILLLALGIFVIGYALFSLSGYKNTQHLSSKASLPFGLIGGIFSALFGSGGFLYAIYLTGRLENKNRIRITQNVLISVSTLIRAILFLLAGVYANQKLLVTAALLAPIMIIGIVLGRHITMKLSKEQFLRLINLLILASGVALTVKYLSL